MAHKDHLAEEGGLKLLIFNYTYYKAAIFKKILSLFSGKIFAEIENTSESVNYSWNGL